MRRLMWITIGVCIGIALGIWLLDAASLLVYGVIFLLIGLLLRFIFDYGSAKRVFAYLTLGIAFGMCWLSLYNCILLRPASMLDGQTESISIRVTDYSSQVNGGTVADGKIRHGNITIPVRFYIQENVDLKPGDVVSGEFRFQYTGYDAEISSTYHQGKGIQLLAYAQDSAFINHNSNSSLRYLIANIRHGIHGLLDKIFPDDIKGFAVALLLGDSSGLSTHDDNALQNSGIRHIIAVSGLHISILSAFVHLLFANRRWITAFVGIPILVIFAAVAGFTPSVVRACVMQALIIIGKCADKEYDPASSLSFAVLVILVFEPAALASVGFQLSVGCVAGIFLFAVRIKNRLYKWRWLKRQAKGKSFKSKLFRWMVGSVSVSISAMLLTIPISAHYFGVVSLVSVLSNLLTLWVITYIFCGVIFSCIFALIYTPLGAGLAWVVSYPIRYVLWISDVLSRLPFASVSVHNIYVCIWLIFAYGMFIVTLFSKEKHIMALVSCIGIGLISTLLLSYIEYKQDHFRVSIVDVGQGQCIILQNRESCYIVDCGGDSGEASADKAAQMLRTYGIQHVNGLILTHFDQDHAGGAEAFVSQMKTDTIYLPDTDPEDTIRLTLEEKFEDKISWVYDREYIRCGDDFLTIYPQDLDAGGNESSMCILYQTGDYDILITGDLDADGERAFVDSVRLPEIEVLVVGHHGANTSSSLYFLNEIKPKLAVISVGDGNKYGHPNWQTIDRLALFNCRILRTDINGTIVLRG